MVRAGVPAAVLHVPGRHRPPPAAVAPVRHAGQLLPRRDDPARRQRRRPHSPSAAAAADQAVNGTRAVAVTHDRVVRHVKNSDRDVTHVERNVLCGGHKGDGQKETAGG